MPQSHTWQPLSLSSTMRQADQYLSYSFDPPHTQHATKPRLQASEAAQEVTVLQALSPVLEETLHQTLCLLPVYLDATRHHYTFQAFLLHYILEMRRTAVKT